MTYAVIATNEQATSSMQESSIAEPADRESQIERPVDVVREEPAPEVELLSVGIEESSISADEVAAVLEGKFLTELQQSQILTRLNGRRVQWRGVVFDVSDSFTSRTGEILLSFTPDSRMNKLVPWGTVAWFPSEARADLAVVSSGDRVLIEGTLTASNRVMWSVTLEDCQLRTQQRVARAKT